MHRLAAPVPHQRQAEQELRFELPNLLGAPQFTFRPGIRVCVGVGVGNGGEGRGGGGPVAVKSSERDPRTQ